MDNETTIEGRNAVMEALRAGRPLAKIMLAKGIEPAFSAAVKRHARSRGIPVVEVGRSKLDATSAAGNHQGVIALGAEVHCYSGAGEILDKMQGQKDPPLFVILDGIKDPHNLGAIIRTCDAVGATGVVIPKRGLAGLQVQLPRHLQVRSNTFRARECRTLPREVDRLKKEGFWIVEHRRRPKNHV